MDAPSKSGARYAKLYADENEIYFDQVVERSNLFEQMQGMNENPRALVFVDDFVGTGQSAKEYFDDVFKEVGREVSKRNWQVFFIAVIGFQKAKKELIDHCAASGIPITIHFCDTLDEESRCFQENSEIFPDPIERKTAKDVVLQIGLQLEPKWPLGYKDSQALVVFDDTCPNNTIPILWAHSLKGNWTPLFRR